MKVKILISATLAGLLAGTTAYAATITKADNTNALGSAASWVGDVAPGASDIANWSGTYSASENNTTGLTNSLRSLWSGTALAWQGIRVGSLTGTALTTNTFYAGTSGFGAETNISAATQSGNLVTITTKAAHGFAPGLAVTIAGVTPSDYNGTYTVLGVPSSTTFTYATSPGLAAATGFGTAEGMIYIGGTASAVASSGLTVGSSGIDLSAASHSVALSASSVGLAFAGDQTWNLASGRYLRLGGAGISAASAKIVTSGSDGVIDITGAGVVDANQGGASGFADAAGFTGFTGKWRVNSGATLRGLRNGATAWGSNPGADSIILNGGTLAVGGMSGSVGNWTWTNAITLAAGTTSYLDEQNVTGSGRSLLLNGAISGSGNLVFRESLVGGTAFTSQDLGFILTGENSMSGTVVIGGAVENGVAGRLTFVRVGGVGGSSTSTAIGSSGTLGTATITNNGVLTFSRTDLLTVNGPIHGTGSIRIGYNTVAGAESQNVTLSGVNTYSGDTRINMGTLTLGAGASIPNTANIFLTPLTAASLISVTLDASASGLTLNNGQRLVGGPNNAGNNNTAQVNGNVSTTSGSGIVPGGTNNVNTLMINGDLNLGNGTTLVCDLSSGNNDLLTCFNLNPSGVTTIAVTPPAGGLFAGLYTLIQPSGTLGGSPANFALTGLAATGRGQSFGIIYDGGAVKLQVVGSPAVLTWKGDDLANVWDTGTTTNWLLSGNPDAFFSGDFVTFDDSGSGAPAVTLTGGILPSSITVSATKNYTFAGSGFLTGTGVLTNTGPGTLSIFTANDFTGKTAVTGGTLAITNEAALGANPPVFAPDQLTLDGSTLSIGAATSLRHPNRGVTIGANSATLAHGAFAVTVSNFVTGAGALTKTGTGTLTLSGSNTYTGGTIVSDGQVTYGHAAGLGRGASTSGTSGYFVKPWTLRNGIVELNGRTSYEPNFAGGTAAIGVPVELYDGPIVFGGASGGTMLFRDTGATVTNGWGNGTASANTVTYDATGDPGPATIAARFAASGSSGVTARTFEVGDSAATSVELDITGAMGVLSVNSTNQDGRNTTLVKAGPGTLRISAPNNFPGWLVNDGTLLVNHAQALGADRTISTGVSGGTASPNTLAVAGGSVDLNGFSLALGGLNDGGGAGIVRNNGASASTLTVGLSSTNSINSSFAGTIENGSGGVALVKVGAGSLALGGVNTYTGGTTVSNGTLLVNGSIVNGATVRSGGTLGGTGTINGVVNVEADGTLTAGDSIGTLTLGSSPVLGGSVRVEVDRNEGSPLADQIVVTGNPIAYGGTLVITNTGALLQPGDTFQLFTASGYSGGFNLASWTPGQVITWNTANLTVNGTISVASASGASITAVRNGDNLELTWPADALGAQLQVQTNSISVGIGTNWYAWPGSTSVSTIAVPIDQASETVFMRLVYPAQ